MSPTGSAEADEVDRSPVIAACLKRVETRASVDPLTGAVQGDPQSSGPSAADEAALEWALRMAQAWGGSVLAVSAGRWDAAAGEMLRGALAAGASRAVHVNLRAGAASNVVAAALAPVLRRAAAVCCGDASTDRGSGSVPPYLASMLSAPQALGLVHLEIQEGESQGIVADRRLDRGRRERLSLALAGAVRGGAMGGRVQMVISVEAGTARLRRASLPGVLSARDAAIQIVDATRSAEVASEEEIGGGVRLVSAGAYRPRTHVVPAPSGSAARERIVALTGVQAAHPAHTGPRLLRLGPADAATAALDALAEWGELP